MQAGQSQVDLFSQGCWILCDFMTLWRATESVKMWIKGTDRSSRKKLRKPASRHWVWKPHLIKLLCDQTLRYPLSERLRPLYKPLHGHKMHNNSANSWIKNIVWPGWSVDDYVYHWIFGVYHKTKMFKWSKTTMLNRDAFKFSPINNSNPPPSAWQPWSLEVFKIRQEIASIRGL